MPFKCHIYTTCPNCMTSINDGSMQHMITGINHATRSAAHRRQRRRCLSPITLAVLGLGQIS